MDPGETTAQGQLSSQKEKIIQFKILIVPWLRNPGLDNTSPKVVFREEYVTLFRFTGTWLIKENL